MENWNLKFYRLKLIKLIQFIILINISFIYYINVVFGGELESGKLKFEILQAKSN